MRRYHDRVLTADRPVAPSEPTAREVPPMSRCPQPAPTVVVADAEELSAHGPAPVDPTLSTAVPVNA